MTDRKKKWQYIISLIHRVEIKYGSIKATPVDDPDWEEISDACSMHSEICGEKIHASQQKQLMILRKVNEGYSKKQILAICHIGAGVLNQVMAATNAKLIPHYLYVLSKDGERYYLRSKLKDVSVIVKRNFSNTSAMTSFLKENNWLLIPKTTIWKQVPVGCYYISRDHTCVIKKIDDEYEG